MAELNDFGVSFAPYFNVPAGRMSEFRELADRFMAATSGEQGCLYYGFCFNGHKALCREGYQDADAFLVHLNNVGELFAEAQQIATIERMEMHGPADELDKLRKPLADLDIEYFVLETGFRR
ncbi:MAG: hypothetical protein PF501_13220 [Salinisphaera sp.]|jgi:quinol monooxygenase YgiN|nr:hypothetical protein [Salinisphaera sp.]